MQNNKNKKSSIIGVVITALILIFLVIVSNIKIEKWSELARPFTSVANGIQGGIVYIKNKITGNDSFFIDLESLKKENEELKKENTELQQKMRVIFNHHSLQGVLVEHSYLCSECKKVGHNIVYYDNIIVI